MPLHGDFPLRQLLTPSQAARYLGLTTKTLAGWRALGLGPAFLVYRHDPELIRYDQLIIDEWMASNLQVRGAPRGNVVRLMDRACEIPQT